MPDLNILYLIVGRKLIPHHHHLIIFSNIPFRDLLVVDMHLPVHFYVFVVQAHHVLVVLMTLDWNRTVVVEKQVEQRYVLSVLVVHHAQRLFSDLEHHVTEVPEKYLWRCVLALLLNFLCHIFHLYVNVLQASLGL
jgi:hypothetical protein